MGNLQQADTEDCTKMPLTKDIKLQLPISIFFLSYQQKFLPFHILILYLFRLFQITRISTIKTISYDYLIDKRTDVK